MTFKEKINQYINDDPMGPLLIPMGMMAIPMLFLFLLFSITYTYDTWYSDKYVTEVSRSEPADGIVTEYGIRTEVGYKPIYEKVRRSNGKTSWTVEHKVGEEKITTIHHYIKFKFYDNLIDDYRVSDWYKISSKMSSGHKFYTWQAVTYYDSHKDETTVKIERVN